MTTPQCCENPPALNPAGGEGKVVDSFGGLTAYVTGAADSKAAVILISDVFGFEAPKLRKIADKVASSGYFVVVPDFFHGDSYAPENADKKPIQVWIKEHPQAKAFEEAKPIIAALKEQGVLSVGAAGYCWGAKGVVDLAKAREIHAAVMLHPSFIAVDDIEEVKCPIAILGAEVDHVAPPELVKQFEQVLSSKSGDQPPQRRVEEVSSGHQHGIRAHGGLVAGRRRGPARRRRGQRSRRRRCGRCTRQARACCGRGVRVDGRGAGRGGAAAVFRRRRLREGAEEGGGSRRCVAAAAC